ncbi:MAG: flagellar biosynthesis protein FlhF [Planctomycetales bacterium]|nr:flagellar biosynthesis protein FlhF [Planctomycetales bacterium]
MTIKTFRATSLQEALQQVRATLGPDASVHATRELKPSRLNFLGKRPVVEVEASANAYAAERFPDDPPLQLKGDSGLLANSLPGMERKSSEPLPPSRLQSDAQRLPLTTTGQVVEQRLARAVTTREDANATSPQYRTESNKHDPTLTPAALDTLVELMDCGIPPELSTRLLRDVCSGIEPRNQHDPLLLKGQISRLIAKQIQAAGALEFEGGVSQQRVAALVGPTGVGKTTTLAKIAAGFRFDLGLEVGLITLDTFRLGAVDQLLQYAELISAQLEVVSAPEEINAALQRLRECDLVLIDTAGRSLRDTAQLAKMSAFMEAAQPDATFLVLSATSSQEQARESIKRFAPLKPTNLIITKLDESFLFGSWLTLLQANRLPVSYVTVGQQVPHDILVASPRRLASMVLGQTHQQTEG